MPVKAVRTPCEGAQVKGGKVSDTKSGGATMRTGLDFGHSDGRVHDLAQEGAGECAHGSLGGAIHATTRVRFPSRDRPEVDDVTCIAGLEVFRDGRRILTLYREGTVREGGRTDLS